MPSHAPHPSAPTSTSVPSSTTASSSSICRLDPLSVIRFFPVQTVEEFKHPVVHFSPLFAHHFFGEDDFIWGFETDLLISFYFIPFSFEVFLSINGRTLPHLEDSTLPLVSLRRSLCERTPFPGGLIEDAEQFEKVLLERQTHPFFPPGKIILEIPFPLQNKSSKSHCPSFPDFAVPPDSVSRSPCLTPPNDFPPSQTLLQIRECTFQSSEKGKDTVPLAENPSSRLLRSSPSKESLPPSLLTKHTKSTISGNFKRQENVSPDTKEIYTFSSVPRDSNVLMKTSLESDPPSELVPELTNTKQARRAVTSQTAKVRKGTQKVPIKTENEDGILCECAEENIKNTDGNRQALETNASFENPTVLFESESVSFPLLHRRMEWFLHWFIESASPIESDERWRVLLLYIISPSFSRLFFSPETKKITTKVGYPLITKTKKESAPFSNSLSASFLAAAPSKIPPASGASFSTKNPRKRTAEPLGKEFAGSRHSEKEEIRLTTLRSGKRSRSSKESFSSLSCLNKTHALNEQSSFSPPPEINAGSSESDTASKRKQRGKLAHLKENDAASEDVMEKLPVKKSVRSSQRKPAAAKLPVVGASRMKEDVVSTQEFTESSADALPLRFHLAGFATTYTFFSINQNRRRISQFMVFPHMQKRGIGMELLEQIYYTALQEGKVCEITVEDPASTFTQLRDIVSLKLCFDSQQLPIACLYPPASTHPTKKEGKNAKKASKDAATASLVAFSPPVHGYEKKDLIKMTKETTKQATRMRETLLLARVLPHPLPKCSFPLSSTSSSESTSSSHVVSNGEMPSSSATTLAFPGRYPFSPTLLKDGSIEETGLENSDLLKEVKAELQRKWLEHFNVYYRTIRKLRSLFPL